MGYSMKGSPAKLGTIKGTTGHTKAVEEATALKLVGELGATSSLGLEKGLLGGAKTGGLSGSKVGEKTKTFGGDAKDLGTKDLGQKMTEKRVMEKDTKTSEPGKKKRLWFDDETSKGLQALGQSSVFQKGAKNYIETRQVLDDKNIRTRKPSDWKTSDLADFKDYFTPEKKTASEAYKEGEETKKV